MPLSHRNTALAGALVLALAARAPAPAQDKPAPPEKPAQSQPVRPDADRKDKPAPKAEEFEFQLLVARATDKTDKVPPELKDAAESLRKTVKFRGLTLERKAAGKTGVNKTITRELIDGYSIEITPKARDKDNRVQLELRVTKKDAKDPVYTGTNWVKAGESLPIFWDPPGANKLFLFVSLK